MKELWKPIKGYEGLYEVSNSGKIKSLGRVTVYKDGRRRIINERVLRPELNNMGCPMVNLSKKGKVKHTQISILVWDAFGDKIREKLTVDHIDRNRTNNNISNLQLLSQGDNVRKNPKSKSNNLPLGVFYRKDRDHYYSEIAYNNKIYYLGSSRDPANLSLLYQNKLKELKSGE